MGSAVLGLWAQERFGVAACSPKEPLGWELFWLPPTSSALQQRELGAMNLDEPQDRVTPNVYYSTTVPVCLCSWQNVWRKTLDLLFEITALQRHSDAS